MLDKFFNPRSVAIIGASHKPGKIGYVVFENFLKKFKGEVYPVNPDPTPILGRKVYPSVREIPDEIDLAVIATPARVVPEVMEDCATKRIPAAVILSGGFSEVGAEGKELEEKVKEIARRGRIRIIGPNGLGILDTATNVDTIFVPEKKTISTSEEITSFCKPSAGGISFISQSGAFGVAVLEYMVREGLGLNKFISYGNRADVDEIELMEYLLKDVKTKVILLYVEGIERGRAFLKIAKKVTRKKPVVAIKAGRTENGKTTVLSHTGAMAGSDEVYSAAFRQCGIVRARDLQQLCDFAKVLSLQPPAKGNRVGIITCGGGAGVMTVDRCIELGIEVPSLPNELKEELNRMREKAEIPAVATYENVIDLSGSVTDEMYGKVLDLLLSHPTYDGCIVIALHHPPALTDRFIDGIIEVAKKYKKPVVASDVGISDLAGLVKLRLEKAGIPLYTTYERAVESMKVLIEYGRYLKANGAFKSYIKNF